MQQDSLGKAVNALDRVVSFLKPDTSSRIKSAVVALYSSQQVQPSKNEEIYKLRFSGQIALLHLDYDRKVKNYFLRLYDLQRLTLLLQVELYYNFMNHYRPHQQNSCLYYFQYLEEGHFAFLFQNTCEAQFFQAKLTQIAPKQQSLKELRQKAKEEQQKERQANSFFGKFKGFFKQKQANKKQQTKIVEIRKSSAIMFDNQGGIITENISPEWKQIIKNSGLKKADLKKPQVVQTILEETLIYEAKRESIKNPCLLAQSKVKNLQQLTFQQPDKQVNNEAHFQFQSHLSNENEKDALKSTFSSQNSFVQQQQRGKNQKNREDEIPIPPPINLLFSQSHLNSLSDTTQNQKVQAARSNLLEEIRTNRVVLKPVKAKQGGKIEIDISSFNKEERKDLGEQIRLRLQKRALHRRQKCQDSEQDSQN